MKPMSPVVVLLSSIIGAGGVLATVTPLDATKLRNREVLAAKILAAPPDVLITMGLSNIKKLGTYKYRLVKRERVGGTLLEAQEITTYVREEPWAVRLQYVKGPAAGRQVTYNPQARKDDFRVREVGLLSIAGPLWIALDSPFAKLDSNHTARDASISRLLERLAFDLERGTKLGGFTAVHEGFNADGAYCMLFTPPKGTGGTVFEHSKTRVCADLEGGVPAVVEGFDGGGQLLEQYLIDRVEPTALPDWFFDPERL